MKTNIQKTFTALLLSSTLFISVHAFAGNTPTAASPSPAPISSSITQQIYTAVGNLGYRVASIDLMNDGSGNYYVTLSNGGHVIYYPSIGIVAVQDLPQ
jgi:hypothetical protein